MPTRPVLNAIDNTFVAGNPHSLWSSGAQLNVRQFTSLSYNNMYEALATAGRSAATDGKGGLMSDLRFCPNCGERVGATARFCGGCGHALPVSTSFPAEAGSQPPGGVPTDASPGGRRAASTSEQRQPPPQSPQQGLADTGVGPRADASWSLSPGSSLRPNWDQLSGRIGDVRGSFATGDWAGAARTALIPIGVVFLISVLVAWSTSLSFGQTVAVGAMLTSLAAAVVCRSTVKWPTPR
jgi:hypothetical protein